MIDYVEVADVIVESNHIMRGVNQFGYGSKISTCYKVKVENKWRRVYATCFSNVASHWVIINKQKKFLMDAPHAL